MKFEELQKEIAKEGFWDDLEHSQTVLQESKSLEHKIATYDKMESTLEDLITLIELTIEDGSFYSTAGADSIKTYGLDINKATTNQQRSRCICEAAGNAPSFLSAYRRI